MSCSVLTTYKTTTLQRRLGVYVPVPVTSCKDASLTNASATNVLAPRIFIVRGLGHRGTNSKLRPRVEYRIKLQHIYTY